uniref:Uncharacterized protein n=1 Tax=Spongospora subterranea TaxID=70186 RepID=A0A0H5R621_9EUKA|eukprot:CRZ09605.1 hypothetical protein [Spongospora subterranea]
MAPIRRTAGEIYQERRAGLETCFLEAVAEDVHRSETDSSGLVLSDEKQTRGLTLLSEQFQADFICDSNRLVSEQNFGEENVDVSSDHYSDNTQETSQQERLRFSNRHVENRVKKPTRRKPITTDEAGLQEGGVLIEKRPRKVDKKRRSRSKILDIDPLDKAMEVANRIEQALASGDYERWSDGEKEGASEVLEAEPASDNDLSIIPYPKHKRRGAKQKLALPDTHLHSVPSPITLVKAESRRRLGKFTDDEVYELKKGIAKHGVGQWKEILEAGNFQEGRTTMDIKDKYRNMVKKNNIAQNH